MTDLQLQQLNNTMMLLLKINFSRRIRQIVQKQIMTGLTHIQDVIVAILTKMAIQFYCLLQSFAEYSQHDGTNNN